MLFCSCFKLSFRPRQVSEQLGQAYYVFRYFRTLEDFAFLVESENRK